MSTEISAGKRWAPDARDSYTPPPPPLGYVPGETRMVLTAQAPNTPKAAQAASAPTPAEAPAPSSKREPVKLVTVAEVHACLRERGAKTATEIARSLNAGLQQVSQHLASLSRSQRAYRTSDKRWVAGQAQPRVAPAAAPRAQGKTKTEQVLDLLQAATRPLTARQVWERFEDLDLRGPDPTWVSASLSALLQQGRVERLAVAGGSYQWMVYGRGYTAVATARAERSPTKMGRVLELLREAGRPMTAREIWDTDPEWWGGRDCTPVSKRLNDLAKRRKVFARAIDKNRVVWSHDPAAFDGLDTWQPPADAEADRGPVFRPAPEPQAPASPAPAAAPLIDQALDQTLRHPARPARLDNAALEARRLHKLAENWIDEPQIQAWLHDLAERLEALA